MYQNLVFKGGGVRGIAYAGALQVLEEKGIMQGIERVAGTSAGAITAMLVALKYSAAGIKTIVNSLDFSRFEDSPNLVRVATHYGYYAGEVALEWIEANVSAAAGPKATFADLRRKGFLDLRVVSGDYNTCYEKVYSFGTTPDAIVSEAVRASMSIPFFFKAMQLTGSEGYECDGGAIMNYPIDLFDAESDPERTLGLFLTDFNPQQLEPLGSGRPWKAAGRAFQMVMNAQDRIIQRIPDIMKRTVKIDGLGISATDFHLTDDAKTNLFNSGVNCATKFLHP